MSELIQKNDNRATIRWKLLTGASAMALTAYVSAVDIARAEDASRPSIWVELGGQLDLIQGFSGPFTAPFMSVTPEPDPYRGGAFNQSSARYALGLNGKISFQPEGSDWVFSAGIRYGRSHRNRHVHHQTVVPSVHNTFYGYAYTWGIPYDKLADTHMQTKEQHAVLDFAAGKDLGLGVLGASTISAGVRFAQFSSKTDVDIQARPTIGITYATRFHVYAFGSFHEYMLHGRAERSFKGIGPSLSWSASAALAGNPQDGELTVDWGLDAALLFGRQKARTSHATQTNHLYHTNAQGAYGGIGGVRLQYAVTGTANHSTRSRSVTVPNVGGFAGLSVKYPNVKFSIGYRYDTFLNAMDTGIDVAKRSDVTFHGPFASISIGIGD